MDAYIVKAYRTAVGKANRGSFKDTRAYDLAVDVINHIMNEVPQLDSKLIDDVIVGCANPEGEQGLQIGRRIALGAFGKDIPGVTVNRYCGSGLETIAIATAKIRAGMGEVFIAGGAENMSMIPMTGYKLAPNYHVARDTPDYVIGMGLTAEAVSKKYNVTREDQDEFAVRSHKLAHAAQTSGRFDEEIVPIEVERVWVENNQRKEEKFIMNKDEGIRAGTNMEVLSKLRPAFALGGTVTAGNSSQTSDGAAFSLVMSERMVKELNLEPIGRLVSCTVAGVDPLYMGIGPRFAIPKALKQAGLTLNDIDLIELNEAFAAQAVAVIRETGLDPDIVNVNGGAIALGHPLGCTGAKLTAQILHELDKRNKKYGIVTACIGGGQGIAGVVERF